MDAEAFKAALRARFGVGSFAESNPPGPVAVFPARHPAVGDAKVWLPTPVQSTIGELIDARISIGSIFEDEFQNIDTHLAPADRFARVTEDIVRFLDRLFSDRLLLWRRVQDQVVTKCRECSTPESFEPLAIDNEEYAMFLWSGPQGTWQLAPTVLKRGAIWTEIECEVLRQQIADRSLSDEDCQVAIRLIREYERGHP
jgi:hypothetical protein